MGKQTYNTLVLALGFFALAAAPARADQRSAQQDAGNTNDHGSNDSLHESYGNALHAVSNFFDMNIPGAVRYGIKAYGQYRNSNQMDDLHDKNNHLASSLSSVGGSTVTSGAGDGGAPANIPIGTVLPGSASARSYSSPYARLDKAFLHEGAVSDIAGKLEKMSGMSRDQMFDLMVDVHSHSKSPTDPDFVPWAMKTYHEVSAKMPNAGFRAKLDSLGGYLDKAVRSGLAESVLAKFQAVDNGRGPATMVAGTETAPTTDAKDGVGVETAKAPAAAPVAVAAAGSRDETGLSDSARFSSRGSVSTGSRYEHMAFEPVDGYLGEVMKQEKESDDSPSIFQVVSSKIREMTVRQRLERSAVVASGTSL